MARLSKETTIWRPVDASAKPIAKQLAECNKLRKALVSAYAELHRLKNIELVKKGELPEGMSAVYSHRFGRWTAACERSDGSIIAQAKGARDDDFGAV